MNRIKYFIFTLVLFCVFSFDVRAEKCDSNDIARLKEIAKNVTVNYEYDQESSDLGSFGLYIVTVSGLTEEIYGIVNLGSEQESFFYTADNQGIVEGQFINGDNDLLIYSSNCNEIVRTVKVKLPYYNDFSNYEECDGISGDDLYVCEEFLDKSLSYSTFKTEIKRYNESLKEKEEDNSFDIRWFLLIGIVVILGGLVFAIVRKIKSNRLD